MYYYVGVIVCVLYMYVSVCSVCLACNMGEQTPHCVSCGVILCEDTVSLSLLPHISLLRMDHLKSPSDPWTTLPCEYMVLIKTSPTFTYVPPHLQVVYMYPLYSHLYI